MDEQKIVNISVKSLILCVVFGTVCWLVSLKPAGFDKGFLAGILGGIVAMTIFVGVFLSPAVAQGSAVPVGATPQQVLPFPADQTILELEDVQYAEQ